MANPFVHIELSTDDAGKAKEFYGQLLDWKLEDMDMGPMTYTMINVGDEGTGGGIAPKMSPQAPNAWMPYVQVDDVTASAAKAVSLGATVLVEKQEVPNMGYFVIIIDPTGATIGLWQTA
jgi:predicted enzyme related to lactoylglutathione lyase